MKTSASNNIVLGIIILIATSVFVYVLFNIGGGSGLFRSEIKLLAKFPHVKGLHSGSEVSLAGLRIGVIKKITIAVDTSKELTIELAIARKFQDRVRQDSVATIRTQGVLGDKYIEISIGSPDSPALKHGNWIQTDETTDILTKGGNLVEGIAKQFTKGGDVELLLRNLNRLVGTLNIIVSELESRKVGQHLGASLSHTEAILKKVRDGDGTLGALINDPSVYEDLKQLMGGAKRSTVLKYFMRQFIESGQEEKKK